MGILAALDSWQHRWHNDTYLISFFKRCPAAAGSWPELGQKVRALRWLALLGGCARPWPLLGLAACPGRTAAATLGHGWLPGLWDLHCIAYMLDGPGQMLTTHHAANSRALFCTAASCRLSLLRQSSKDILNKAHSFENGGQMKQDSIERVDIMMPS